MNFKNKKTVTLGTHSSNFHADDLLSTVVLKLFFKLLYPDIKVTVKRTLDEEVLNTLDIVYDIGKVYDPKKLRFDHHQKGGSGMHANGVTYAAFGLVWKEFGARICAAHTKKMTGKSVSKKDAEIQAETIEKRVVSHIDGMDNGQMTYTQKFVDAVPFTLDGYFEMCKIAVSSSVEDIQLKNKAYDKEFFRLVPIVERMFEDILSYAMYKNKDEKLALSAYAKAADKRIIVCDRFYGYNFGKLPEPLVIVFPDPRGSWAAKVVRLDESAYDARFYFPESWAGLTDGELEKVTGIAGSVFCHNAKFLVVGKTKKIVLELVYKAFALKGI